MRVQPAQARFQVPFLVVDRDGDIQHGNVRCGVDGGAPVAGPGTGTAAGPAAAAGAGVRGPGRLAVAADSGRVPVAWSVNVMPQLCRRPL